MDLTYNQRLYDRNYTKTRLIIDNLEQVYNVLDIGCNEGYISKAILKGNKSVYVDAVEQDKNIVKFCNPFFHVYIGDIKDYVWMDDYDVTIYCSVHHHVIYQHGLNVALEVWERIKKNTRKYIFFETYGVTEDIASGGKILMRFKEIYKDDQQVLNDLKVMNIQKIGELGINGGMRSIYKVIL